ncbi:MAG: hypothetical protein ABIQ95_11775 [Bdellovibrionia bacterium]
MLLNTVTGQAVRIAEANIPKTAKRGLGRRRGRRALRVWRDIAVNTGSLVASA